MRRIPHLVFATLALSLLLLQPRDAAAQGNCASLSGTIFGSHHPIGWTGTMLISVGDAETQSAAMVDVNNTVQLDKLLAGKAFRGTETMTLTFADGSTLVIPLDFIGVPSSTPALYTLSETGDIAGGTGRFTGAGGHVTVHGPFLSPVLVASPPWISEVHGTVCGVQ